MKLSFLISSAFGEYFPNSPTEDTFGYAASITRDPLRNVFETMQYDGNYYLKSNSTWHLHDPSSMRLKDGVLTLFGTGKENADGYQLLDLTFLNYMYCEFAEICMISSRRRIIYFMYATLQCSLKNIL